MTLRPRPLIRETGAFRDDRLVIVACEDSYAPKQYFEFFRFHRVQIHVIPTQDGQSSHRDILERLLSFDHEDDDERWLLIDIDHRAEGSHVGSLVQTLCEAKRQNVKVAICNPCFELWLLLHHVAETECIRLGRCKEMEAALRDVLGSYNKRRLREEHFGQMRSVVDACDRARRLDETPLWAIPGGQAAQVHRLWDVILACTTPHMLPEEFQNFGRSR